MPRHDHAVLCGMCGEEMTVCCVAPVCLQEQVGPYVHRVYHEKLDVLWDANGRVYYKVRLPGNLGNNKR
jgi:hypothetical protein